MSDYRQIAENLVSYWIADESLEEKVTIFESESLENLIVKALKDVANQEKKDQ
jgi:hypothetical protein